MNPWPILDDLEICLLACTLLYLNLLALSAYRGPARDRRATADAEVGAGDADVRR